MTQQQIPPPWLQAQPQPPAPAAPEAEVPRSAKGTFVPGHSGNPAGRPRGIVDRRHRVAQAFDGEFDAIGLKLVELAKDGDVGAISLYLSRVEPPLRPRGDRTPFALDTSKPLAEQAAQVIQAVADGHISGDDAQVVLSCLSTYAKLVEADTLEARLQRLERNAAARGAQSGVVYEDPDES